MAHRVAPQAASDLTYNSETVHMGTLEELPLAMCVLPYLEKNSRQTDVGYRHDPSFLQTTKEVHGAGCRRGQTRR